ncbi:MAG: M36 family metallopeptidase [Spirosomataceae bacterium]
MKHQSIFSNNCFLPKTIFALLLLFVSVSVKAQREVDIAKRYLTENAALHKLVSSDIDEMVISGAYLSPTTGWYHVYFNQTFQSIEIYNGLLNVTIKGDNVVVHVANNFVVDIASKAIGKPENLNLTPVQALQKAALNVNLIAGNLDQIKEIKSSQLPNGLVVKKTFTDANLSNENIEAKLCWLPTQVAPGGGFSQAILTWNVRFLTKDSKNGWNIHVDAFSGEIVKKTDEVISCSFGMLHKAGTPHECSAVHAPTGTNAVLAPKTAMAPDNTYNVFDYPVESPNHGVRTVVSNPYTKFVPGGTGPGATNGWHNDGASDYTTTRGNNVWAMEDTDDSDMPDGASPTSTTLDFNFPYTQGTGTAAGNQNAAITNLFYWNNLIHDVLWKYGFDETGGNFQKDNLGRGGTGNDFVYADAQDGEDIDNANFYSGVDGQNGRMQMFLWTDAGGYQPDGDFDNGVISHEYGHGWSVRLTGGPANSSCLDNVEQGGEGWADYLALMLTTNWASLTPTITSANLPRGIGNYVLGEGPTGDGIRKYPYSYNMAVVNPLVTYAKVGDVSYSEPHGIGSIWATMLWDMTWEIILQDNQIVNNIFTVPGVITDMRGNIAALKLVNEGLRMQPCSPSFVDARDAILAADQTLFNGRYRCAISRAFARRGLGVNASTGASSDDRIVTEDFTPIPGADIMAPTVSFTPAAICSGTSASLSATIGCGSNTVVWYDNADMPIPPPTTTPAVTTTYKVACKDPGGCESPKTAKTFYVLEPAAGSIAASQSICSGEDPAAFTSTTGGSDANANNTPGAPAFTYLWERSIDGGPWAVIAGQTGTTFDEGVLTNVTAVNVVYAYRRSTVETLSGVTCTSLPTAAITITVKPRPVIVPTADQSVCANDMTTAIAFSANVVGTTFSWTKVDPGESIGNPGGNGPTMGNIAAFIGINTSTTLPNVGTFTVIPTANGCTGPSDEFVITVKPRPSSNLTASQEDVCPNTEVTLDAQCSIPTATVNWNPGAPTVTPNAPDLSYIYTASCTFDGCTGVVSDDTIRTHRILVNLKNVGIGAQPKALAGMVKDNLAPANLITAPTSPRLWTIVANGCSVSESAVFKLTGPINFSSIDNNPPYAIFANVGADYFAIDHPNYGNGGSGFPNGTYTLTVDLRGSDGVGGPFPKNRVATGALLATRILQFTVGNSIRSGVTEEIATAPELTELKEEQWVSIGQNPVSTEVVVRLSGKVGQSVELSLVNLQGQPIQQRSVILNSVQQYEVLNVEKAASGMYVLKAVKDAQVKTLKVVKTQ